MTDQPFVFDWWDRLSEEDCEYLLGPPKPGANTTIEEINRRRLWERDRHLGPCPFCRGRQTDSKLCEQQKVDWEPRIPFGEHKGRRISEIPKDYLEWLHRHAHNEELKAAIKVHL